MYCTYDILPSIKRNSPPFRVILASRFIIDDLSLTALHNRHTETKTKPKQKTTFVVTGYSATRPQDVNDDISGSLLRYRPKVIGAAQPG
jgi:hypothetical protein